MTLFRHPELVTAWKRFPSEITLRMVDFFLWISTFRAFKFAELAARIINPTKHRPTISMPLGRFGGIVQLESMWEITTPSLSKLTLREAVAHESLHDWMRRPTTTESEREVRLVGIDIILKY